jgi:hypothetical protein
MKREQTPWERCIITSMMRDITGRGEKTKPSKPHWTDWGLPLLLFAFMTALMIFMHFFPNGIWSL